MKRSYSYRRHQEKKAKNRARRFLKMCDRSLDRDPKEFQLSESNKHINLYARNRKPCSCYMCRNEKYRDNRQNSEQELNDEETK